MVVDLYGALSIMEEKEDIENITILTLSGFCFV